MSKLGFASLLVRNAAAGRISSNCLPLTQHQQTASFRDFVDPPKAVVYGYPDNNRLKMVNKQPTYPTSMLTPRMTKRMADVRGPELIHNKLIHKQFGIVALSGGNLKHGHFEMMRNTINRNLEITKQFAVWRVDPPWKPVTRHGQGKKLGGGKGAIDHWVTPVKRGRVIVEVGGSCHLETVSRLLLDVAQKLPFPAKLVEQADLDEWEELDEEIRTANVNKLRWEWCLKNNVLNVVNTVGKYDLEYAHLGPDCR